ncbi:MAG: recombinase RecA [Crenarchaeota archaeon]|nr:recombinase RecA [Thermoproteota archaeon]
MPPLETPPSLVYYDMNKACTGVYLLDRQLQGGFRRGEIYLIAGEAGMGKTIFALQFLKTGADRGEVGIYITVDEPSEDVKRGVKEALGWDLEQYETAGKLIFLDFRTHFRIYNKEANITLDPRELAKIIIDYIKRYNAKRLVIDPIAPLIITSHHDILWVREYLRELVFQLKKFKDVTTVLTSEIPTGEEKKISRFGVEEYLASGVIVLTLEEYFGRLMRVMFIRKMRWTPISPVKLVFEIRYNEGIVVLRRLDEYLQELSRQYGSPIRAPWG